MSKTLDVLNKTTHTLLGQSPDKRTLFTPSSLLYFHSMQLRSKRGTSGVTVIIIFLHLASEKVLRSDAIRAFLQHCLPNQLTHSHGSVKTLHSCAQAVCAMGGQ